MLLDLLPRHCPGPKNVQCCIDASDPTEGVGNPCNVRGTLSGTCRLVNDCKNGNKPVPGCASTFSPFLDSSLAVLDVSLLSCSVLSFCVSLRFCPGPDQVQWFEKRFSSSRSLISSLFLFLCCFLRSSCVSAAGATTGIGQSCNVGARSGVCQQISDCLGPIFYSVAGYCPGAVDVQVMSS